MINDPRKYTKEYPDSNIIIKQALNVIDGKEEQVELIKLLIDILKNENDALINVALNLSPNQQVASLIWDSVNLAVNSHGEDLNAHIFAIPLILVAGSKTRQTINGQLDVNKINEFFFEKNIFSKDSDSFISGKLIEPQVLAKFKPSQYYYWVRNLKNAKLWLPVNIDGSPIEMINEGVFLRFLIGISIDNSLNQEAYRNSSIEFMKLIGEELKNPQITLFPIPFAPVKLSEAFAIGDNYRKEIAIQVAVSNIIRKIREQGLVPHAYISTEGEAIKLVVASNDNQDLSETSLWQLNRFDEISPIISTLVDLLTDMQVEYNYVS